MSWKEERLIALCISCKHKNYWHERYTGKCHQNNCSCQHWIAPDGYYKVYKNPDVIAKQKGGDKIGSST